MNQYFSSKTEKYNNKKIKQKENVNRIDIRKANEKLRITQKNRKKKTRIKKNLTMELNPNKQTNQINRFCYLHFSNLFCNSILFFFLSIIFHSRYI